jgi:Rho-binding antiterminator
MALPAYRPVSCDFHDQLEELATLKKTCLVRYGNEAGEAFEVIGRIADIFTKDKEEFLKMSDGQIIRLDHIREAKELRSST